ncbi:MAG: hypothetical protein J5671_09940 [Bacteroidaceae bacterium]|nr:hypothetical protein [Bacteroidaceae bacterium]
MKKMFAMLTTLLTTMGLWAQEVAEEVTDTIPQKAEDLNQFMSVATKFGSGFMSVHHWCTENLTGFYHTLWPYLFIAIVSILTIPSFWWADEEKGWGVKLVRALFVLFPLAMLLELGALMTLGFYGSIWWCNPDKIGLLTAVFRVSLLLIFLLLQIVAMFIFTVYMPKQLGAVEDEDDENVPTFHMLTAFLSIIAIYPLFWLGGFAVAMFGLSGTVGSLIEWGLPLLGLLSLLYKNIRTFGPLRGFVGAALSLIIVLGFLGGLGIFFITVLKLFLSFILACPLVIVFIVMGSATFKDMKYIYSNGDVEIHSVFAGFQRLPWQAYVLLTLLGVIVSLSLGWSLK